MQRLQQTHNAKVLMKGSGPNPPPAPTSLHSRMVVFTSQASPSVDSFRQLAANFLFVAEVTMMESLTLIHPLPADEINVTNQP